ncbi:MAG: hypothetical protein ACH349_05730 [Candidatus Rhabdochlamydia sp.]|mgnify:FL=1|jgi:hypothetical protein|nr:hypothetical protein [Chlamydiota bacterium]
MTIHNNPVSYATTNIASRDPQTLSSTNNRVEKVAFDVLLTEEPNTEQLRFELKEYGKTGSQYYTIATWKGKRYRITVHDNKRKLAYLEDDWQRIEHQTIKVLNRVQNDKHFVKGNIQLHGKTKNKWKVTYENNTHVERSINKKVIREFKNLFESQIKHTNTLLSAKSPQKLKRALYPLYTNYREKKERTLLEVPKKIFEVSKKTFKRIKNHFFPPNNNINDFDDLSSHTTDSRSSFEEVNNEQFTGATYSNKANSLNDSLFEEINTLKENDDLDDAFSDKTSLGGISDTSSHVSNDSGSSYSLRIK